MIEEEPQRKVLVPIAEGFEEIEAITVINLFRRAGAQVTIASIMPKLSGLSIHGATGITIVCDSHLEDVVDNDYDLISLPGGLPGATYLSECQILIERLKKQRENKQYYGAICASPFVVFQKHGLINKDVPATCHPGFVGQLINQTQSHLDVVVSGKCVTGKSAGTAMDYGLQLLKLLYSEAKLAPVLQRLALRK